jgi:cytochrome c peroxidase
MQGHLARRWCLTTAMFASLAAPSAAQPVAFNAAEIERIVALGPWPPPAAHDRSNRVSGRADAIELGRRLFFDSRLSPVGYIACVTCHQPDRGWTDHKQRAHGLGDVDRNTQALNNLGLQDWFGWGGTSDSLWMASLRPILDPREMDSNPAHVRRVYVRAPEYACLYRGAFGVDPVAGGESDEAVLVRSAKVLASFTETLTTGRTGFDDLRDALARGEPANASGYPAAAQRGLRIFVGKGHCVACHSGPNFSDGKFHDTGVPFFVGQRTPDRGRDDGIRNLRSSHFSLLGRYNDDASLRKAAAARSLGVDPALRGEFRTPSLRNVAVTAPYMHNGSLDSLHDVIRHYTQVDPDRLHGSARRLLRKLDLGAKESEDLIAFLRTLTDFRGEDRGLPTPQSTPCDALASASP